MDIGPGARSAPVVTVVSQDQLQHVRRQRNSTSHHSNALNHNSNSVGGDSMMVSDRGGDRSSMSIDRDGGGAFSGGEDLSGSCVWLSSRLGETSNVLLSGDAQSPIIDRNEASMWNAERDDELSRLMWCEGDVEEEGGVTASEETNAEYCAAAVVARRSLGDVLGDHCLQNLIESPCSAPEPHRQPVRNGGKKVVSAKAGKPAPKTTATKAVSTVSRARVVQPAPVIGGATKSAASTTAPTRRQKSASSSLTSNKVEVHKSAPTAPIPFERQHARAQDTPSVLSTVMVQLSRDLAQRTLSGTFGGRSTASPSVSPFENTAYGLEGTTSSTKNNKPTHSTTTTSSKNIRDIRYTAVGRDGSAPRHTAVTEGSNTKASEAWWERLAPKSPSRAVSANSSRRVSIVSASDMHCIAPSRHDVGDEGANTRRRSASHSHMPTHLRQPVKGFTQQTFRKDDAGAAHEEPPRPQVQRRRSVSAQSSLRRPDGRDASFLRPTEASQSRKEAAALSSTQTKLATTSTSSLSMSHTGFRQDAISPPRAASAGRNQALFERLYTHRTENTTNYIVSTQQHRHDAHNQHQQQLHPPAPSPSKPTPSKAFVPSCATRNDRRSHLAKVYNLPEPPPRTVPQVRRYVPKSKQPHTSPSPPRTSVSPSPSRSAGVRSPVGVSRGQVLYEQTRSAQLARKQEVIAQAMLSHSNRRYDASQYGGSRRTSMGASSLTHYPPPPPPHPLVADNTDVFVPLRGDSHLNMADDSLTTPRSDAVSPSSPGGNHHRSPKPSRLDLNSLFVSTPVLHRSLQQENTHRPNHPTTPRAQHALSPYETSFDMPLRSPGGRADDGDVVAVAIPAVMDTL